MALEKEIWISDIQSNLYAMNPFMTSIGKDDSAYVDYKTVHLPQSGIAPNVVENRTQLPAPISKRTDSEVTYDLAEYTTDPILLTNIEELQISYNKRQDVLSDHVNKLSNSIANKTLYKWAPSGATRIVRTSGANSALALSPSATGTRKKLTLDDIAAAAAILDKDNFDPMDGRALIVSSDVYWTEIILNTNISKYLEYGSATLPSGKVPRIMGFDIMVRPSVVVYDNTGTPVIKSTSDAGIATGATSDNVGMLAVAKNSVRKALGSIKVFSDEEKPEYYGSIFSALVMHGAAKARTNQEGIVAIVQAA